MKRILIMSALAATGLAAGAALAADRGGHRWDKMDADGDGEISLSEMDAKQQEFLSAADTDGNGAISKEEMKAFHQSHRADRMGDTDGDGVISRAEYDAKAAERFEKMDANGDGVISEDEGRGRRGHGKRGHQ